MGPKDCTWGQRFPSWLLLVLIYQVSVQRLRVIKHWGWRDEGDSQGSYS